MLAKLSYFYQESKMPKAKIDYDQMISLYHDINRTRDLYPHETERLTELIRKKNNAEAQRRYREKNIERLNEKRRQWAKDNPDQGRRQARNWRAKYPSACREACQRWREKRLLIHNAE